MKRFLKENDPGIESEVIRQVKDYIAHCKKFDAPCTTHECIEYIAENFFMDYDEIEQQFGSLITDMMHIMTQKDKGFDYEKDLEPSVAEAVKFLKKNGYKVI